MSQQQAAKDQIMQDQLMRAQVTGQMPTIPQAYHPRQPPNPGHRVPIMEFVDGRLQQVGVHQHNPPPQAAIIGHGEAGGLGDVIPPIVPDGYRPVGKGRALKLGAIAPEDALRNPAATVSFQDQSNPMNGMNGQQPQYGYQMPPQQPQMPAVPPIVAATAPPLGAAAAGIGSMRMTPPDRRLADNGHPQPASSMFAMFEPAPLAGDPAALVGNQAAAAPSLSVAVDFWIKRGGGEVKNSATVGDVVLLESPAGGHVLMFVSPAGYMDFPVGVEEEAIVVLALAPNIVYRAVSLPLVFAYDGKDYRFMVISETKQLSK